MQFSNMNLFQTDCDSKELGGIYYPFDPTHCADLHAGWTGSLFQLTGVTITAATLVYMSHSFTKSASGQHGYYGAPLNSGNSV